MVFLRYYTTEALLWFHATASMTRAPAPEWVVEPARYSDWVRSVYHFAGKGAAGGHNPSHHATAPVITA